MNRRSVAFSGRRSSEQPQKGPSVVCVQAEWSTDRELTYIEQWPQDERTEQPILRPDLRQVTAGDTLLFAEGQVSAARMESAHGSSVHRRTYEPSEPSSDLVRAMAGDFA